MTHGEHEKAAENEHTPGLMYDEIWLQCPNRDSMSEWYGEVTWAEDQINDDDTKYVRADIAESLNKQRDELLKAAEAAMNCIGDMWPSRPRVEVFVMLQDAIASVKADHFRGVTKMIDDASETSIPAIVFYPAGSLGEPVDREVDEA